jgi:Ser/Thr protein kinase RdoA (MazF antagonist)
MPSELFNEGASGALRREGDRVIRPTGPWSASVHQLLLHLEARGFDAAPRLLDVSAQGHEELTFIDGTVGHDPLLPALRSDAALVQAMQLLRRYHDATVEFVHRGSAHWQLAQPDDLPLEVICHNDFAPYNCVFRDGLPIAMVDFDMAGPGSRVWDVAYTVYRFVPLCCPVNLRLLGWKNEMNTVPRLRLALSAYGLANGHKVIDILIRRLALLRDWTVRASEAETAHARRITEDAHVAFYNRDLAWLVANRAGLQGALDAA